MPNAIAICGRPRRYGNTETLLIRTLNRLKAQGITAELITLSGKNTSLSHPFRHAFTVQTFPFFKV